MYIDLERYLTVWFTWFITPQKLYGLLSCSTPLLGVTGLGRGNTYLGMWQIMTTFLADIKVVMDQEMQSERTNKMPIM